MSDRIKCVKCRWMFDKEEFKSCSSQSSLYRGIIDEDDELINYDECMDFTPLSEFEDESLRQSLEVDRDSEIMSYD